MKYKLMLKQHNVTGLKYLCITKRQNYHAYTGSGKRWLNHLKKHGKDFTTILLEETDDIDELSRMGEYYSDLFDVVHSDCFANLVKERGYVYPENNAFALMSEEQREEIYKQRKQKIKKFWDNLSEEERLTRKYKIRKFWSIITEEQNEIIKQKIKNTWANKSEEEKLLHAEIVHQRWENMSEEDRIQYSNKMAKKWADKSDEEKKNFSEKMKNYRNNLSEEEKENYKKKISEGRKNMSEEDKKIRAEKCRQNYIDNPEKYQHLFDKMSEERKGIGNPAAKLVEYNGIVYNKLAFEKEFGKIENYTENENFKKLYEDILLEHDIITCPYCGKQSNSTGSLSAFKRWHFENCKQRRENAD